MDGLKDGKIDEWMKWWMIIDKPVWQENTSRWTRTFSFSAYNQSINQSINLYNNQKTNQPNNQSIA